MEQAKTLEQGHRTHPIVIVAGVAVLLFSLLGAAALTGILPTATPKAGDPATPQVQPAPTAQGQPATRPAAQPTQPRAASPASQPRAAAAPCIACGVIEAIRTVEVQGKTSGVGAVAGGIAGGVLGNQFGHGTGKTLMTVGGAAGGAFAGDAVEGHMKKHTAWRVTVRLEDGSVRTLQQSAQPPFAIGDRVRIVDGNTIDRV